MQKVLVTQAQNTDCLGVMDQLHTGDPAGKSETDKQNQRAVGKPSRLCHVPGREDVPDRAVAFVSGSGRRCPAYLADALGAGEEFLKDGWCKVLGDGLARARLVTQSPRATNSERAGKNQRQK